MVGRTNAGGSGGNAFKNVVTGSFATTNTSGYTRQFTVTGISFTPKMVYVYGTQFTSNNGAYIVNSCFNDYVNNLGYVELRGDSHVLNQATTNNLLTISNSGTTYTFGYTSSQNIQFGAEGDGAYQYGVYNYRIYG